jgi:hypothetical protein
MYVSLMYEVKKKLGRYFRVKLLGPGPRLIKNNLPGRGLTKVEKHCSRRAKIACIKFVHFIYRYYKTGRRRWFKCMASRVCSMVQ